MPTRNLKFFLPIGALVLAALIAVYAGSRSLDTETIPVPINVEATSTSLQPTQQQPEKSSVPNATAPVAPQTPTTITANTSVSSTEAATLIAGTQHYTLSVLPGETLATAMQHLASTNPSFTYTTKEYPGLGLFVQSINGTVNEKSYYWFLYVNGKQSSTGISATTVHPGDQIEWKYEQ